MKKLLSLFGALAALGLSAPAFADHPWERRAPEVRHHHDDCADGARWREHEAWRRARHPRWHHRRYTRWYDARTAEHYWNGAYWVPFRR